MDLSKISNISSENKPYVMLLVGPPLVGKDFFVKKFKKEIDDNIEVISRDQIILDLYGSDDYDEAYVSVSHRKVESVLKQKLKNASDAGLNVIINMTNLSLKRRRKSLSYFDDNYIKVAIVFSIPDEEELQRRNSKRLETENKSRVTLNLVKNMILEYQPITEEEKFNNIINI
jgi:predicted kinase